MQFRPLTLFLFAVALVLGTAVACSANTSSSGASGSTVRVVAAENFWGSIAMQLGGSKVTVTSIVVNPNTDPHGYEATPKDGRSIAAAQYVIYNGAGYDPWAAKLVGSNPTRNRRILDVGNLVGARAGDNPHRWYSPGDVQKVIDQITSDYKQIDAQDAGYFDQQRADFNAGGLQRYNGLIEQIKQRYAGVPVGASESIFTPLAQALGLNLVTPELFLDAIGEGSDPAAADKATVDQQIKRKQIKVFIFNSQNSTPDIKNLVDEAKANGIPVVSITETLAPANATFQDWQSNQLQSLADALARATGG